MLGLALDAFDVNPGPLWEPHFILLNWMDRWIKMDRRTDRQTDRQTNRQIFDFLARPLTSKLKIF